MRKTNFFIMIAAILCFALPVNAKQYCQESITSNGNTISLTCELFGMDNYRIIIESETDIMGLGGSFMHINESQAEDLRKFLTISADKKTATISFISSTAPNFYTPLYILMPGEVSFAWPSDITWGMCSTDATEYAITVVQPATGGTIAADKATAKYGDIVTLTATANEGLRLDEWIVKDAAQNVITVQKNQFSMPASAVTITATFEQKPNLTPATFSGKEEVTIDGSTCTFNWSITRTVDELLSFSVTWDKEVVGIVPQVCIDAVYYAMAVQNKSATYTTENTYEDGTKPVLFFYIAYAGGATRIDVDYTVGADNNPSSGVENIEIKGGQSKKIIKDGILYIENNGVLYNVLGIQQ